MKLMRNALLPLAAITCLAIAAAAYETRDRWKGETSAPVPAPEDIVVRGRLEPSEGVYELAAFSIAPTTAVGEILVSEGQSVAKGQIVATLRSWKGHRFLVEAVAGLPESVGLVIVGDGPQREALQKLVHEKSLDERILFAGNQRDVVPWFQALDVFALPSYANEGVPQALIQAMLVGLPCVTTHVGSIAELATHEVTALVVPPRDVAALRAALQRVLLNDSLKKSLGAAARRHCAEHFSYAAMLARMEAIYLDVAHGRA